MQKNARTLHHLFTSHHKLITFLLKLNIYYVLVLVMLVCQCHWLGP